VSQRIALAYRHGSQKRVSDDGQKFGRWCGRGHTKTARVMRPSIVASVAVLVPHGGDEIGVIESS
jgi:hypothetical protein